MKDEIKISGEYMQEIFFAENHSFSIVRVVLITPLAPFAIGDEILVTGRFPRLMLHERYEFTGNLFDHPKYGQQFQAVGVMQQLPQEKENIIRYLKQLKIKGIGQKTIEQLYDFFGEDILQILTDEPVAIFEGFSGARWNETKAQALSAAIKEQQGHQSYFFTLIKMGFQSHIVVQLQEKYKNELQAVIEHNAYQLLDNFDGISLHHLDDIVQKFFPEQLTKRIKYAIIHHIKKYCYQTGSSVVTKERIIQMLEQDRAFVYEISKIEAAIAELVSEQRLFFIHNYYALDFFYETEQSISQKVHELLQTEAPFSAYSALIDRYIKQCETDFGISYAKTQHEVIKNALLHPLFLMTGGPGTGKTTIIRAILEIYLLLQKTRGVEEHVAHERIALLAPTGRAAQRMQEMARLSAKTIHRFLGWDLQTNSYRFNAENPLKTIEFIIIDEASMLDMWVLASLLKAVPNVKQIIFVGDANQLPSIVGGQCFSDMLKAKKVPQSHLTRIFRQKKDSTIIDVANSINNGQKTDLYFGQSVDYNFLSMQPENLLSALTTITQNALNKGYNMYEIQVLAPLYKGHIGIDAINKHLQNVFNPDIYEADERLLMDGDFSFLPNDKVIQLKNLPDLDVYNGDIGKIISIERLKENAYEIVVDFSGNLLIYSKDEMKLLRHAYCISIHKAQGSEFQLVIMPIFMQYSIMLYRQLLYTGVSRAKKALIILGQQQALLQAVANNRENERKTLLAYLLSDDVQAAPKTIVDALAQNVIGEALGKISPWDFLG